MQTEKHWNRKRVRSILTGPKERITWLAVGMAEQGCWSLEAIANECGLSPGAVLYRLSLFGITIRDIRNSTRTRIKRQMLKMVSSMTEESVQAKAERVKYIGTRIKKG